MFNDISLLEKLAINSFDAKELQASYQALCGAIQVDGNVAKEEVMLLRNIKQLFGITEDIVIASRNLSYEQCIEIHRKMDDIKKILLVKYMAQLCIVDGEIDFREDHYVTSYAQIIGCPDMD